MISSLDTKLWWPQIVLLKNNHSLVLHLIMITIWKDKLIFKNLNSILKLLCKDDTWSTLQKPLPQTNFSSFKVISRNPIILKIKPFILYHGRTQIIIFIPNWLLNSIAVATEIKCCERLSLPKCSQVRSNLTKWKYSIGR